MKKSDVKDLTDLPEKEVVAICKEELPYKLDAYHELLRRHERLVYNTCVKMIGSVPDAEETCQDAFLQVFHKLHQFEGRSAFKTWLFRIVYNLCLARRKKIAMRREREGLVANEFSEAISLEETRQIHEIDLSETIQEALGKLNEDQRKIIVLKYVSGLSLQEIADVMSLKLSATKMRLYRALEEFKKVYLIIHESDRPDSQETTTTQTMEQDQETKEGVN